MCRSCLPRSSTSARISRPASPAQAESRISTESPTQDEQGSWTATRAAPSEAPLSRRGVLLSGSLLAVSSLAGLTGCAGSDDAAAAGGPPSGSPGGPSGGAGPATPPGPPVEPDPTPSPAGPLTRHGQASLHPESRHVLVNKLTPLQPVDFEPGDLQQLDLPSHFDDEYLRPEPAAALEELFAAAEEDGHQLGVTSAYRSFNDQLDIYDRSYVEQGSDATDAYSARPGYSEHQTGLAVDILTAEDGPEDLEGSFGDTPEGIWVADHAHEFGFIIRYPEDADEITGYSYEPWHLRYVGLRTAAEVVEAGQTLEEFWGEEPAPDYEHPYTEDPALAE